MSLPVQRWPDEYAERYRRRGYWRGETFSTWFRERAEAFPDRLAVVGGETRWRYGELASRADALAAGFLRLGFRPGDRVIVQLPNVPEFVSVTFALFHAGLLPVFALPAHRRMEIAHIANTAGAVGYVIADSASGFDYRSLANDVLAEASTIRHVVVVGDPDRHQVALADIETTGRPHVSPAANSEPSAVALLQLSGGSTGLSKLIPRTHDDYIYSVRASAEICGLTPDSVYLGVLPIAHNFPMSSPGFLGTLYAGGTVVLSPSPTPGVTFPLIARERVTITSLVPPLALVWLDAAAHGGVDLSSLQVLQVGGAKLVPEVARRIGPVLGVRLQQVFGMAEGLVNYTRLGDNDETIVETQGRPISPDDEIVIVDDATEPVAPGTTGHLLTRGPYTIRAYYNDAAANRRAFTADGFYRTGDLVRQTSDGNLVVVGRATDQINRGGEKISGEEIENHLIAHPAVFDAVVIAVPDPYLGERACAFVIPRGEAPRPAALKAWIRERGLAPFKVPDQVVIVDAFPTTGVGKVSRMEIRAALRDQWRAMQPAVATREGS